MNDLCLDKLNTERLEKIIEKKKNTCHNQRRKDKYGRA